MEKTIKIGDRVCVPNSFNQLLLVEMIETRIFPGLLPTLALVLSTLSFKLYRMDSIAMGQSSFISSFLSALIPIVSLGMLLLFINMLRRNRKICKVIVTKDYLIVIGGLSSKVTRLIKISSIKNIKVKQINWWPPNMDAGSVTIETEYDSICWRGYTNSSKLKNLVEMIQGTQQSLEKGNA